MTLLIQGESLNILQCEIFRIGTSLRRENGSFTGNRFEYSNDRRHKGIEIHVNMIGANLTRQALSPDKDFWRDMITNIS